jgi:hypothetical protein
LLLGGACVASTSSPPPRPPCVALRRTRPTTAGSPYLPLIALLGSCLSLPWLQILVPLILARSAACWLPPSTNSPFRSLPQPCDVPNLSLRPHMSSPGHLSTRTHRPFTGIQAAVAATTWLRRASSPTPSPPHLRPQMTQGELLVMPLPFPRHSRRRNPARIAAGRPLG